MPILTKTSYSELLTRSNVVANNLIKLMDVSVVESRFSEYQQLLKSLSTAWENNQIRDFTKRYPKRITLFALKELKEIIIICEEIFDKSDKYSLRYKNDLKIKLKTILGGPFYTFKETSKNSNARNIQFELRIATTCSKTGLTTKIGELPDVTVEVDDRKYFIECKRIIGKSERTIFNNLDNALNQINNNPVEYYSGIICLDVSPQFDNGNLILKKNNVVTAEKFVLDQLEKYVFYIYKRSEKLKKLATKKKIGMLWLNFSGVYEVQDGFGWINENGLLVLNKENKLQSEQILKDFSVLNVNNFD